jgi:hypothetical protein
VSEQPPPRAIDRLLFGSGRSISGTVYGTIVAMSVITAAGSTAGHVDPWRLAGFVASSAVVFWLAHVYASALDESIRTGRRLDGHTLATVARHEAAIPLAAAAPIAALCLGAVGVIRETRSIWLALALGVATLGIQAWRYAQIESLSRSKTVLIVALNLLLGLALVLLKAGLSH